MCRQVPCPPVHLPPLTPPLGSGVESTRLLDIQRAYQIDSMGGKVWSDTEERYFWRTAMSFSPKRVGIDRSKPEMSWPQLATHMQSAMGDEARRQYTETMMCKSASELPQEGCFRLAPSSLMRRHCLLT